MIPRPSPFCSPRCRGVALVIVLAFVALLTVLAVAFFSRAITVQQISNSSANKTMVDDFAGAAIATVIGDLKQEIAAGSTVSNPASNVFVYAPTTPQTFVPAIAGFTPAHNVPAAPWQETDGLANLVKVSAAQAPFYQGSNYNTTAYPPPGDATIPVASRSRAMGPDSYTSTTVPSQNGRVITTSRWNKGLLLAKKNVGSDTDFTPFGNYMAPDWIIVAKDGSNPAIWPTAASSSLTVGGGNPAVGRYAYNIYDEGGLLDVNAAGYPPLPGTFVAPQVAYPAYKKSLAYADLTQLLGISSGTDLTLTTPPGRPITGLTATRQPQVIQTLVGWRNYASSGIDVTKNPLVAGTPVTGSVNFPNYYSWTNSGASNNLLNILNFTQLNGVGFLHTANPLLVNGQSDRLFTSRQQLLDLLLNSVADQSTTASATAERAALQNAMQYLGTFSRGLDQPSVIPANTVALAPYDLTIPNGGNDAHPVGDANGVDDKVINPNFLVDASVRVSTSKAAGRNDGSDLVTGEPLVKRRFALNYLAWLTYQGPSSTRTLVNPGATGSDADMYGLENTYGFSSAFLQQGTDNGSMTTNIPKYFGLTWDKTNHLWKYIAYQSGTSGAIMTLAQVASAGREANFFELLKAAITVGSLGKAYTYSPSATGATPDGYAQLFDNSVDAQVMQIGANIIDQFDLDSYPTRIQFNDGLMGSVQEYDGVEDLPYLYRVREAKIMTADSTPTQNSLPAPGIAANFAPGSGVVLQEPEIWNPHAWNATQPDANLRPTSFRFLATSATPAGSGSTVQPGVEWRFYTGSNPVNPGTASGTSAPIQVNATLAFSIPQGRLDLFREPTLLIKPNVPAGCNLSGGTPISSLYPAVQYAANLIADNHSYLGIVMGTVPMAWTGTIPQYGIDGVTNPPIAITGMIPAGYVYYPISAAGMTYRTQYQDYWNVFQTYDLKFAPVADATSYNVQDKAGATANRTFNVDPTSNTYMKTSAANVIGSEMSVMCFDPRTRRFGMEFAGTNGRGSMAQSFPLGSSVGYTEDSRNPVNRFGWAGAPTAATNSAEQAAAAQNALMTTRPDEYQGMTFSNYNAGIYYYGINAGPTAAGWLPSGTSGIVSPGLFAQNNPDTGSATSLLRYSGDGQPSTATSAQYFADADNVVRRGMSAYVPIALTPAATPAPSPSPAPPSGLPMKPADVYPAYPPTGANLMATPNADTYSRPMMLNRPFQSPAELGYVFSGTPWRNLDFSSPESGSAPLLDLFCVSVNADANGLSAGKVNLNTRQEPVLQAVLSGAYRDRFAPTSSMFSTGNTLSSGASGEASKVAGLLMARTSSTAAGQGPLRNVSELVGLWNSVATGSVIDGHKTYVGFVDDWAKSTSSNDSDKRLQSFREAPVRALAASGQTRVWNLLIDVVAQTGRYPQTATTPNQFIVEGEQRYWVHVAIDRLTGQVIDKQVEVVKE